MNPTAQTLTQLESARTLALGDGRYYPTIIPGVLPIIGGNPDIAIEIRRWGAEFLAETFSSPAWTLDMKDSICMNVLPTLKEYLDTGEDIGIVKSAVQAAASLYPLVFRRIIFNPNDSHSWKIMTAIKSNILRRMDTAAPGVRICCVKFVQQVILVETPGRTEQNDISLIMVPQDHPLISYSMMEAESSGLLDRLLDIIHGDHSDALLVTATLNCLGTIIQRRSLVAGRVMQSILNFNPLKLANSPMTPKNKVLMKSIERTNKMLLTNYLKRHPDSPYNGRIHQHLERIARMHVDIFDENNRKRPAPVEPTDGLDAAKRQRLGAQVPAHTFVPPPLPPGPVSYAQLFTLAPPGNSTSFDVSVIPADLILKLLVPLLHSIDSQKLDQAINLVRARYAAVSKAQANSAAQTADQATAAGVDDEDEYEPDFDTIEDAEQIVNKLDNAPDDLPERAHDAPLAPFKLPRAPPLSEQEVQKYGDDTVRRLFGTLSGVDENLSKSKLTKPGFNRLAASSYDRDSWLTILTRLATRSAFGLEGPYNGVKLEHSSVSKTGHISLADKIREGLFNYIMYDWRKRIDVATNWLCEEWYNDRIQLEAARDRARDATNGDAANIPEPTPHYKKWALRIMDAIVPYVENTDKGLIRFLSEIPEIDRDILQRVKHIADDPDRVHLTVLILQYLLMFRPPARELCIDLLEDLWKNNNEAKPFTKKLLAKWRPEALETEEVKTEPTNGSLEVKAA